MIKFLNDIRRCHRRPRRRHHYYAWSASCGDAVSVKWHTSF